MSSTIGDPRRIVRNSRRAKSTDFDNEHDGGRDWHDEETAAPETRNNRGVTGTEEDHITEMDDRHQDSGPGYSNDENEDMGYGELSLSRPALHRDSDRSLSSPPGSSYSPGPGDSDVSSTAEDRRKSRKETQLPLGVSDVETRRPSKKRSPLKRSRSEAARSQDPDDAPRPFKRVKGNINRQYVALLNADIEDARDRHVPHPWPELPSSQIGLTFWTPEEKHFFFEALSRLGRHKPELIAARLETKSEMEVRQYLDLLERAKRERRKGGQLDPMQTHQVPAAVELGQECVAALEQAGDSLSLHQEAHEEAAARSRQRKDGHLLLTADNCRELVDEAKLEAETQNAHHLNPLVVFNVRSWLELSERLFMNASFEEMNWQSVSHEAPSIRLVALDDFYAIVRAVTRKLVCEAVFNARTCSRGRSRAAAPKGHVTVHARHVPSPEQVVGKPELAGRELFFAGCARRLRLAVVDDQGEEGAQGAGDAEPEFMPYEDVENALSDKLRKRHAGSAAEHDSKRRDASPISSNNEQSNSDEDGDLTSSQRPVHASGGQGAEALDDNNVSDSDSVSTMDLADSDRDVEEEVDEVVVYSAFGIAGTSKDKNALRLRIRGEREREHLAEAVDCRASYVEERRLWADVLGRSPTVPPERVPKPDLKAGSAAVAVRRKLAMDDMVQELA